MPVLIEYEVRFPWWARDLTLTLYLLGVPTPWCVAIGRRCVRLRHVSTTQT